MSFNHEEIIKKVQAEVKVLIERAKNTKPVDYAVIGLCAFIWCYLLKTVAWRSKEDGSFGQTMALLFYTAVITLIAALTRPVMTYYHQFSTGVVVFSVLSTIGLVQHSPLFIAMSIPLVNLAASKASQAAHKASTK